MIRNFEIIGEASRLLPDNFRDEHPEIEWRKMIGFRNILIHEYSGVDHRLVWSAIQDFLPDAVKRVQAIHTDFSR